MKLKKYTHVFWDWNGTLIDDMDCSLAAVNSMLIKREMPVITRQQYFEYIDTPIKRFYEHIFDFSEITMDEIMEDFDYFYHCHICECPLMKGALDVLKKLQKEGLTQIVLSSSSNKMLIPYTEKTGVKDFFAFILGSPDSFVNGKTERAVTFLREMKIDPKKCVLIGDTLHDYDTAVALGCDCILIPNGHQSKEDLQKTNALIADDISNIPSMILEQY